MALLSDAAVILAIFRPITPHRPRHASHIAMDLASFVDRLRNGSAAKFPADANTLAFAQKLDSQDQLKHLRDEFVLPTKGSLKKRALDGSIPGMSQLISSHLISFFTKHRETAARDETLLTGSNQDNQPAMASTAQGDSQQMPTSHASTLSATLSALSRGPSESTWMLSWRRGLRSASTATSPTWTTRP